MELTIYQQIFEQIKKAGRVLIALPQNPSLDGLSAGLALKQFLEKLQKEAVLAASGNISGQLDFLPALDQVKSALDGDKSLVVVVDTSARQLEELSYETAQGKVSIFLKAKNGQFSPQDISFSKEKEPFDLIVTLDCPSLPALGGLFEDNTELFYETTKINIDHKPENEMFGAINLVDLSAVSVGEILAALFENFETQMVDGPLATCLLAGIISKTDSFQHIKTTPRAFLTASRLIQQGARQQEIVRALYKIKPLNFLRLWGRVLAKLKSDDEKGVIYAALAAQDFEKAGAGPEGLPQALADLLSNVSGKRILAIIFQANAAGSEMLLASQNNLPVEKISSVLGAPESVFPLSPHNYNLLRFLLPGADLSQAENKFLEMVKAM